MMCLRKRKSDLKELSPKRKNQESNLLEVN